MDIVKFRTGKPKEAAVMGDKSMNDEAKKRLERLLQDLQEIEEQAAGSKVPSEIRCDVILSTLESPLPDPSAWKWIADLLQEIRSKDNPEVAKTVVDYQFTIEPFINKKGCFRWRGNPRVWEEIKEWIARLSGFFGSNSEFFSISEIEYGVLGGLQAIGSIATTVPELSPYIKCRCILDLAVQLKPDVLPKKARSIFREMPEERKMPKLFEQIEPKPSFHSLEFSESIPVIAKKVLNHLLGKPIRKPPIRVEFDESPIHPYATVFVNEKPYTVEKVFALIVEQLVRANGNPISQRTITNNCPDLKKRELGRFRRIFDRTQNKVPFEIENDNNGFYLETEWLQ